MDVRIDMGAFEEAQGRIPRLQTALEDLALAAKPFADGSEKWLVELVNGPDLLTMAANEIADAAREFLADGVLAAVSEQAERIDACVIAAADAAGGRCEGLDFHLKGRESLSRKIESKSLKFSRGYMVNDVSCLSQTAAGIRDALRYTIILPFETFADAYDDAVGSLASSGIRMVACKNTLGDTESGGYRGVNTQVMDAETGIVFEVQFHTDDSFDTKQNKTHVWYERQRDDSLSEEERDEAREMQRELFLAIPTPPGIDRIKSF